MKKYLVLFISVIILSLSLCIPSFAANKRVITLSEDYKYMYYDGSTYTRADTSMLYFEDRATYLYDNSEENVENIDYADFADYDSYYTIRLTNEQHKEVKAVEISNVSHDETLFYVLIYFCDGSELHIDFLREDLIDEYNKVINGNTDEYYINFLWPEGNIISINKEKLTIGKKLKINAWDYEDDYEVYTYSSTGSFDAEIGLILKNDNSYYFYSFIDSDVKSANEFWELGDERIEVIELTDDELLNKIKIGEEKRQEDNFGYLYNDELKEAVAKIFFALVFAVIPAVVFISSLILAVKSKKLLYKKLLFATCGISIAEIITFIYIAFTLFNK